MLNDKTQKMVDEWHKATTTLSLEEWLVEQIDQNGSVVVHIVITRWPGRFPTPFISRTEEGALYLAVIDCLVYRSTMEKLSGYDRVNWDQISEIAEDMPAEAMDEIAEIEDFSFIQFYRNL